MSLESYAKKIKESALFLDNKAYDDLIARIGDAEIVLLGEATHGTHEFYTIRAEITKRLITEKNFTIMAIEGDWPDAYIINNFIHGRTQNSAQEALKTFDKFPQWMWQNIPIAELIAWMHSYNQHAQEKISFYGLDVYSLYRSIEVIINYLEQKNPELARKARALYSCFDQFKRDPQQYSYSVFLKLSKSCQDEVLTALKQLQERTFNHETFNILQNARVIKNAETYYRSLYIDDVKNWNLRDSHMMETLEEIRAYHTYDNSAPKVIIWAHNSHIGNAAATQMSAYGEYNIGELVKKKYGKKSFSIGFTTYNGTVSAASSWHLPVERRVVRDALPQSYEHLFHTTGIPEFLLLLDDKGVVPEQLLERAIGVVYAPQTERISHYFYASLADQFDAIIHIDTSTAVEPLEKPAIWVKGEVPETYPTGL